MGYRLGLLILLLGTTACQSNTVLSAGGFRMIHMNNPECMGMSAAGVVIVDASDEHIVTTDITQKSGYCESITGQVITTGGQVLQGHQLRKGLEKSGTNGTQKTTIQGGTGAPVDVGAGPT